MCIEKELFLNTIRYLFALLLTALLPSLLFGQKTETRPNILMIVVDDMGYSDTTPFGGEIKTPNIDRLAKEGVKFTNFYVGPTCSITRSMLFSGNDNHVAGIGNMYELLSKNQIGKPGYEGYLNRRVVSVATLLRDAGYHTYMAGKWHLGRGPDQGPSSRGFEHSFVLLEGGASHFGDEWMMYPNHTPTYREDGVRTHVPHDFYSTAFYTDRIIDYIERQKDDQPFFAYLALTAPHNPLHVPDEWIDVAKGDYEAGYNALRQKRFERMKALGIIPQESVLAEWIKQVPKWNELDEEEKRKEIRRMEIYAAMVANIDYHVGRLLDYLRRTGKEKNTLILFFSDNGASGLEMEAYPGTDKAWLERNSDNRFVNWGRRASRIAVGPGWAQASSTPLRLYKAFLADGGIRSPLIVKGPGVKGVDASTDSGVHVTDLAPTFLELAGTVYPETYEGRKVKQPIGKSMLPLLAGKQARIHGDDEAICWEFNNHKAVRMGRYKATWIPKPFGPGTWELFDLSVDPGERHNLAEKKPELLARLVKAWEEYAQRVGYIPSENDFLKGE
jgi:arylsulfatase